MIKNLVTELKTWALVLVSWASLCCCCTYSNAQQIVSIPIPGSPLTLNVVANPQPLQNLNLNPAATNITMGDDENRNVPLPFTFPFFNQNFNNSWMYSNGAISFQGPNAPGGFCCDGQPLNPNLHPGYNYSIIPLWTDLIVYPGAGHYVLGTANSMSYGWYNVSEYGTNNRSSFEVKIDSTGAIDMRYAGAFVSMNHNVTAGIVGNAAAGEYYQFYHGPGIQLGPTQLSFIADPCVSNPLYSPSCPGYQEAYIQQQCYATPLYSPTCPGYSQAYYTQQCTINPLYDSGCPGYAQAYFNQQCQLNGLYSRECPNYNTAYAAQQTLNSPSTPTTDSTATVITAVSSPAATLTNPVSIATTTPTTTSTTSPTSVTSVTSVIAPAPTTQTVPTATASTSSTSSTSSNTETKKTDTPPAPSEKKSADPKREIAAKAKEAAEKVQNATTMEAQVAAQSSVIGLMGFVPGFGAYQSATLTDINGTAMNRQYARPTVDNRRALQQLTGASEQRHSQMIEQQYKELAK